MKIVNDGKLKITMKNIYSNYSFRLCFGLAHLDRLARAHIPWNVTLKVVDDDKPASFKCQKLGWLMDHRKKENLLTRFTRQDGR